MRRVALIPARGGSKRLPRKNIADFAGRPMLNWTVDAARETDLFDDLVVSTDDAEIAEIARAAGAAVLMRGEEISNDAATLIQVLQHAIRELPEEPDEICLLLANCPLRTAEDIRAGHARFTSRKPSALLSVTTFGWTPPFRAQKMEEGRLEPFFDGWVEKKSQEYPDVVCPTGAVYWSTPNALQDAPDLYIAGIEGFMMPWHRSIDIDTQEDLLLARCIKHALVRGFSFED